MKREKGKGDKGGGKGETRSCYKGGKAGHLASSRRVGNAREVGEEEKDEAIGGGGLNGVKKINITKTWLIGITQVQKKPLRCSLNMKKYSY